MQEVITKFHPRFTASADLTQFGLDQPELFNVERLVEECMAAVGPYYRVDEEGRDFSDDSDAKTASISPSPVTGRNESYPGMIPGVVSLGGYEKFGALRCVVYNPHKQNLRYYFLPKHIWENMYSMNKFSGVGRIEFKYHLGMDRVTKLDPWRCDSFEELAKERA
jgi:hypothetical protein